MKHFLQSKARQNVVIAAGLAGAVALIVFALLRFYPFGDGSILTGDLNGLYVNYIANMRDRVLQGGFFYSFEKLAGGSTLALFAYYMASPLNILFFVVPKAAYPQLASFLFLLRTMLAAGSFCFYIQRHLGAARKVFAFASLGYALCAFFIVYNQNIIWMDVVCMLPLILWALDELVAKGRQLPFIVLLFFAILFNFYTAYAVCLFSGLYMVYAYCTQNVYTGVRRPRNFLKILGRFAASGVLAAGLALFLLVPVLAEVQVSKGGLLEWQGTLQTNFSLWQLPGQLFLGSYRWNDVIRGLPNIYCGAFAVLFGAAFFVMRKIPLREKLAAGGVLGVLVLSFWLDAPNLVWHGLKAPIWFPYRYSFVCSFFLLVLACRAFLLVRPKTKTALALCAGGAAFIVYVALTAPENAVSPAKIVLVAGLVLGFAAALWARGRQNKNLRRAGILLFALLLVADMGTNTFMSLRKFEYYSRSGFQTFFNASSATLGSIKQNDNTPYRVETNYQRTLNDPMLLNYRGISHYSSVKANDARLLREMMGYKNLSTYGWGSTAVADALWGIRYFYSDGGRPVPAHFSPLGLNAPLATYTNPYALPLAYTANAAALNVQWDIYTSTFALQNSMVQGLAPGFGAPLVPLAPQTQAGQMQWRVTMPLSGPVYFAAPAESGTPVPLLVNGTQLTNYYAAETLGGVVCLGRFEAGQTVTVTLDGTYNEAVVQAAEFCALDETVMAAVASHLNAGAAQNLVVEEGGRIRCTAQATDAHTILALPFAYEDNWQLVVNGKEATLQTLFNGMMAVPLQPGANEVELRYTHKGVGLGAAGSLVSLAVLVAWLIAERRKKQAPPKA